MKYILSCKSCDVKIGDFNLEEPITLTELVLQNHNFGAHSGNHWLSLDPLPTGSIRVELTCKHPGCQYFEKRETYDVPAYAVSATVIMFHAKNEGHKFELLINGQEIKPLPSPILPPTPVIPTDPTVRISNFPLE